MTIAIESQITDVRRYPRAVVAVNRFVTAMSSSLVLSAAFQRDAAVFKKTTIAVFESINIMLEISSTIFLRIRSEVQNCAKSALITLSSISAMTYFSTFSIEDESITL